LFVYNFIANWMESGYIVLTDLIRTFIN